MAPVNHSVNYLTKGEFKMAGLWPHSVFGPRQSQGQLKHQKGKNKIHFIYRNLKTLLMFNEGCVVLLTKPFFLLVGPRSSQSEYKIFFILPTHRFNHMINLQSNSDWLELLIVCVVCLVFDQRNFFILFSCFVALTKNVVEFLDH